MAQITGSLITRMSAGLTSRWGFTSTLGVYVVGFKAAGEMVGVQDRHIRILNSRRHPPSVALQRCHAQSSLEPSRSRPFSTLVVWQMYGAALLVGVDVQSVVVKCARGEFSAQQQMARLLCSNASLAHDL